VVKKILAEEAQTATTQYRKRIATPAPPGSLMATGLVIKNIPADKIHMPIKHTKTTPIGSI
jgi:hypothetical protein